MSVVGAKMAITYEAAEDRRMTKWGLLGAHPLSRLGGLVTAVCQKRFMSLCHNFEKGAEEKGCAVLLAGPVSLHHGAAWQCASTAQPATICQAIVKLFV